MKNFILYITLLFVGIGNSQEINQFDANGNRHGVWKKKFDDTEQIRYEGEFNHGREIGLFKFYKLIKKKSVLTATKEFNDSNLSAKVKFLSSKGKVISEGKMIGKTYVGDWIYYHNNSTKVMTSETYTNEGLLTGKRLVYYKTGQLAEEANYVNGKLEGVSKWISLKNVVLKEFIYENNELHGIAKYHNPKGELLAEGNYKRGKKVGIWKYYENGKLIEEKDFNKISKKKTKQ
ncbi:toxin-antitoxin system YwqK family antitoxin [Flavobacteriaceae bacterium AU392]|nr:toxin-antitoxin system YwqK family antitoxin [Flavobacteriaceae bacterium]RKM83717.1 toxin-antitoxin system YwqK family antitoxin [Flavobacteriaceae bacterium AU392]